MQQHQIKAVILDYGGVVAQTLNTEPRAAWERRLGLAPGALTRAVHDEQHWVAAQCGAVSATAHWQAVGKRLGLDTTETLALRATFYRGDVVNTTLLTYLAVWRVRGIRLGLLSNFSTDLHALLQQQNLLQSFDRLVVSADIGIMKPAAGAYEAILTSLALPAAACVFIDDLPVNVEAARALGLQSIVFQETAACIAALEALLGGTR